jgi:hypothetical protein
MIKENLKRYMTWATRIGAVVIIVLRVLGVLTFDWKEFFTLLVITIGSSFIVVFLLRQFAGWR